MAITSLNSFTTMGPRFSPNPTPSLPGTVTPAIVAQDLPAPNSFPSNSARLNGIASSALDNLFGTPGTADLTELAQGMAGTDIEELQRDLNKIGHKVNVDGKYGADTEAAVRAVQAEAGIAEDGIRGEDTDAVIDALVDAASPADEKNRGMELEIRSPEVGGSVDLEEAAGPGSAKPGEQRDAGADTGGRSERNSRTERRAGSMNGTAGRSTERSSASRSSDDGPSASSSRSEGGSSSASSGPK